MDISMAIAIIGCVLAIASFVFNRKDKSVAETGEAQYKMGQIDAKLESISKQIENLSQKLDNFDREIDMRIDKAIEQHEKTFHSKGE